ncbi:hypothetical protein ACJZ2D_014694 [Fusarium nematophilum]
MNSKLAQPILAFELQHLIYDEFGKAVYDMRIAEAPVATWSSQHLITVKANCPTRKMPRVAKISAPQ